VIINKGLTIILEILEVKNNSDKEKNFSLSTTNNPPNKLIISIKEKKFLNQSGIKILLILL
jgi:hypothetical protein